MTTPIEAYERLLVQLHEQFVLGDPDGEEADRIRDEMDFAWKRIPDGDRSLLNNASGNLFLLHGRWFGVSGEADADWEAKLAGASDPRERLRLLQQIDFNYPQWEGWNRLRLADEFARAYEAVGLRLVAKEFSVFSSIPEYRKLVEARRVG